MAERTFGVIGQAIDNFSVGDRIEDHGLTAYPSGDGPMVVTAIDREKGTITMAARLLNDAQEAFVAAKTKQMDALYEQLADQINATMYRNGSWPDSSDVGRPLGAIGGATIAVVTTVAALEWLRQRKAAVAAAEGNEEAYRSLLSDLIVWLTELFAKMRAARE